MLCYKYITLKFYVTNISHLNLESKNLCAKVAIIWKIFLIKALDSQTTKEFFEAMHRIWFG